jgi:ankyrin repeat protein
MEPELFRVAMHHGFTDMYPKFIDHDTRGLIKHLCDMNAKDVRPVLEASLDSTPLISVAIHHGSTDLITEFVSRNVDAVRDRLRCRAASEARAVIELCPEQLELVPLAAEHKLSDLVQGFIARDADAVASHLCACGSYDAECVLKVCTPPFCFLRVVKRFSLTQYIPKFITRDADGRVVAPDYTPSSPHRLSEDDAVNAWLWLIKGDGDVDDLVWNMMGWSKLLADKDSVLTMLAGVHQAGSKATASELRIEYLAYAAESNNMDAVKCLIEGGARVENQSFWSMGVLCYAQDLSMVKYLLDQGASVTGNRNGSPLHHAATLDVARALVEARANVNACGDELQTPPLHSVKRADIAQFLVDSKADASWCTRAGVSPLHTARDVDIARVLIQARANVNTQDRDKITPLHTAKDAHIAKLLVESGASVRSVNDTGETPLHMAVEAKDLAKTEYLIQQRADVNAKAEFGTNWRELDTPLHMAVTENADISIIKCLLENKANVNAQTYKTSKAPLHLVTNLDQCKLLIKHGADVTVQNKDGCTPLHLTKDADVAKCLIEHGTVDPLDKSMQTPLHRVKNAAVARVLLDNGANVNAKDKDNYTPLHLTRDVVVAKLLVEAGADLKARTSNGLTPLGCNRECTHIYNYLIEVGAKK